ncbi:MAG: ComF family protein, partial [Burkholderiales bacterium]
MKHPPAFDRTLSVLSYSFPADVLIQALKYDARLVLAPLFAELMLQRVIREPPPDVLIAMPLHPVRLRERGF